MAAGDQWIQEAILEFLRGPLYVDPIMTFIDERCLIFDTEEENKFEYTTCHEDFRKLVDELLKCFLADIGVSGDEFLESLTQTGTDSLSSFVVSSILTLDDFVQFKAMMTKRNLELTNQVLESYEKSKNTSKHGETSTCGASTDSKTLCQKDIFEKTLDLSRSQFTQAGPTVEEEYRRAVDSWDADSTNDPEMAWAIRESLRASCATQLELAELEQAIALSLAIAEEHQKLQSSDQPESAAGASTSGLGSAGECSTSKDPKEAKSGGDGELLRAASNPPNCTDLKSDVQQAQADEEWTNSGTVEGKCVAEPRSEAQVSSVSGSQSTSQRENDTVKKKPIVPQTSSRWDGYSGISRSRKHPQLNNVRAAAAQAANAQKMLLAAQKDLIAKKAEKSAGPPMPSRSEKERKWLTDRRKELVEQNAAQRRQNMSEYKRRQSDTGSRPPMDRVEAEREETEFERAELRSKMAQKFRQDLARNAFRTDD